MGIHPTAIISNDAKIGADVKIGPYVVVRGDVTLENGVVVDQFATIGSEFTQTIIGERTRIFPGAVIGEVPQDVSYRGEKTRCVLGADNAIREFVTINAGTLKGGGTTHIADKCMLMAYVHIAHDCHIGTEVIIANSCQFAGHVSVGSYAKIGGGCLFNQFIRIGDHAYIAGDSAVNKDVLPFAIAQGKYAVMRAANQVGMERAGFAKEEIEQVRKAIRIITKSGATIDESLKRIQQECESSETLEVLINFVESSERGLAL